MMTSKIYCIAAWSGPRKCLDFDDSYLRRHIDHLNNIKHNLLQVSIGHPRNPDEAPEYTEYIRSLTKLSDGTPIVVHDLPNQSMSYGQWSRIFQYYGDRFSHYIFIEDDYVPVKNHFDSILVDMFDGMSESDNCGYLCGLVFDRTGRYGEVARMHAAVSNGISSARVLQTIVDKFDFLVSKYSSTHMGVQIDFSSRFCKSGFGISDYLDRYQTVFKPRKTKWITIYGPGRENLIVPVDCLDPNARWHIETISEDGIIKRYRNSTFFMSETFTLRDRD
jgi:hypothetical protein